MLNMGFSNPNLSFHPIPNPVSQHANVRNSRRIDTPNFIRFYHRVDKMLRFFVSSRKRK
jgi:hypothetical protein